MGRIVEISESLLLLGLSGTSTETERAIIQFCINPAEAAVRKFLNYDPVQATRTEYYPGGDSSSQGREGIWEVTDTVAYQRQLAEGSSDQLQLQHLPIRSITTLKVDYDGRFGTRSGAFGTDTAWTEGEDFFPEYTGKDDSGAKYSLSGIVRSQGRWPLVAGSVEVVYVAGYSASELRNQAGGIVDASAIHEAVIDEVTRRVQKHYSRMKKARVGFAAGPFTSESLGDYSYSVDAATLSKLVGASYDLLPETEAKLQSFVNYGWALAG